MDIEHSENQINELTEELNQRTREIEILKQDIELLTHSFSNDLRAPLRSINGFSKIIESEYGKTLDEEGRRLLKIVRDNSTRMGVLIDELLNFSRLGRKSLNYEVVDFKKLAEDAAAVAGKILNNKDIFKIDSLLPSYADKALILEVWKNLIANAVKFTAGLENPHIHIGCEANDIEIKYYVADNGVGFNMNHIGKLFGIFQRLHSVDDYSGNGIGLALCEKIIRMHGGTISAESIQNQETVFSFTIPNKIKIN